MNPILIGPKGFVETQGESIYFESYGTGETVVLGHGRGGNHAIWYQQVPVLAQQYQVLIWDQRGFGRSSNRHGQTTPASAAEDLQHLLDHLQIEQAHLVGQSMGGWAALGATLRWPERVKSLIMADTIGGIYTPEIEAAYDAYRATLSAKPTVTTLSIEDHFPAHFPVDEQTLVQTFLYEQIRSLAEPPPATISDQLRQTAYDLNALQALQTPTLFIVGQYDPIFPPAMIRQVASLIPNTQVIEIPNAAHSPYFETPQVWNDVVLTFLTALP